MPPILMRMGNAKHHINYLIEIAANFILQSSNYTSMIEMEGEKTKYVQTMQSNRTFACFAKLKSNLKDKPVPAIDNSMVSYFVHNFKKPIYIETVTNIDIKSAYATILYKDGFITEETYEYICKSSKQERLASVGMLAARKKIFVFKSGNVIDDSEDVSEKSGFFFYAVQRTAEIMGDLQKICGKGYLYTWVDGIYFLPNANTEFLCGTHLHNNGFDYKCNYLHEFEVQFKNDNILVTFKHQDKRKIFNLPLPVTEFKRIMMDAILQSTQKQQNRIVGEVMRQSAIDREEKVRKRLLKSKTDKHDNAIKRRCK